MRSIGNILRNHSTASPLIKGVTAAMTVEAADEVLVNLFGEKIKDHAAAAYVKNGALSIACLSSTVAQEIKLYEEKIIELVNKKVGMNVVKKIKYLS